MDEWHEDSESISRLQTAILKGITDSEAIVKKAGLTASSITISSTIEEDEETTAHNHHPLALAQHSLVKAFAIHALLMSYLKLKGMSSAPSKEQMDRIRLKSAKLAGVMKKAGIDLSSSPSSSSSSTDQQQSSTSSSSSAAAALEMGDTRVKRIDRQAAKRFIGHGTGIKFKESSSPPKGGVKRALEASANEISATSTTSSSSLSAEDADIDSKLAEIHRLTTSPSKKNKTS